MTRHLARTPFHLLPPAEEPTRFGEALKMTAWGLLIESIARGWWIGGGGCEISLIEF
jgi:hypothetical protein